MSVKTDKLRAIFITAVDKTTVADRTAFLDEACASDAPLRESVEALLRAHDKADPLLDRGAAELLDEPLGECAGPEDSLGFLDPPARLDGLGRIGHYEVMEVLGRGGFGVVLRAFDDKLQRVVAVKVLAPALATTSPPRKRFLREARSSARIRHPNVVQIHAVEEQPLPYLVMEYIPGETLQQRLDRMGPLDTVEVLQIGWQIAEGLAAAHSTGLIHRDVKPGNILIEDGATLCVKITDFGLARAADDASLTQTGLLAGTPMFMAPEQASGNALDHRVDLFSLGSVLYTMCSGRPPFRANSALAVLKRVTEDTPRPIPEIIPEVPQWLCDIITRLHAKRPVDRFATAKEVADLLAVGLETMQRGGNVPPLVELGPGAAGKDQPPKESPEIAPAPRKPKFRTHVWATAVALLLMLVAGFGFTEATGITSVRGTVIRLFSPEGTLVVEVDDPGVSIKIDGSDLIITGAGVKEIRLKPGSYTVEARKDGRLVSRELVTVTRNGRRVMRVSQESPSPLQDADAWERSVAGMSAAEQVKAVVARLQELNPGFEGAVESAFDGDKVTELGFRSDKVTNIAPVRVLTGLTSFDCTNSRVVDLSPLKGMKLTSLACAATPVRDLSPLKGMPLVELDCAFTKVDDLSPLAGMQLTLAFFGPEVSDLTPLKGMRLTRLAVGRRVTDLSPLAGMQLQELECAGATVSDLSPLRGMPLAILGCSDTQVTDITPLEGMTSLRRFWCCDLVKDLSPLKGLSLEYLHAGPLVTDLSPLAGMPLNMLEFKTFEAQRDATILRSIKTLETINDMPAAEFWKEVDAKAKD